MTNMISDAILKREEEAARETMALQEIERDHETSYVRFAKYKQKVYDSGEWDSMHPDERSFRGL